MHPLATTLRKAIDQKRCSVHILGGVFQSELGPEIVLFWSRRLRACACDVEPPQTSKKRSTCTLNIFSFFFHSPETVKLRSRKERSPLFCAQKYLEERRSSLYNKLAISQSKNLDSNDKIEGLEKRGGEAERGAKRSE
jgi:hypothetical protein